MKEDYLWDRSGHDAEVERLEDLLSSFRFSDENEMRSNVVEFPVRQRSGRRHWMLAIAAGVAIGAIAIGAWTLSTKVDEANPAQATQLNFDLQPLDLQGVTPVQERKEREPLSPATGSVVRPGKSRIGTQKTFSGGRTKRRKPAGTPSLTADETRAYNQLILALSITSEKLQIVRDTVNGSDEKNTNNR